jgi:hypothetical protein
MIGSNSTLDISSSFRDDVAFVRPRGVLDLTTYVPLRDKLLKCAVEEPRAVVVDVDALEVPTDAVLAVFSAVGVKVSEWPGVPILLVAADAGDRAKLARCAVSRYVPVHANIAEALAAVDDPPARRRVLVQLPHRPTSAMSARQFVQYTCTRWRCNQITADATLAASELVENAVQHTGSEPRLRLELRSRRLTLAVYDDDPRPLPRHSGAEQLGLFIVDRLSTAWGCMPTLAGGKVVWAVLPVPAG